MLCLLPRFAVAGAALPDAMPMSMDAAIVLQQSIPPTPAPPELPTAPTAKFPNEFEVNCATLWSAPEGTTLLLLTKIHEAETAGDTETYNTLVGIYTSLANDGLNIAHPHIFTE